MSKFPSVTAIIIARQGSSRLPGKATLKILGRPILSLIIERIKNIPQINKICVATSNKAIDKEIIDIAIRENVSFYAGDPEDVLDRIYNAAKQNTSKLIYEVGGDCPFVDQETFLMGLNLITDQKYDFVHNFPPSTYPDGLDCPIMTFECLEKVQKNAVLKSHRFHPFSYIFTYPQKFNFSCFDNNLNANNVRLTLDYHEDFLLIKNIFENLYISKNNFSLTDILKYLNNNKKLLDINKKYVEPVVDEAYWNTKAFINDLHDDLIELISETKILNNKKNYNKCLKNYDNLIEAIELLRKRSRFLEKNE